MYRHLLSGQAISLRHCARAYATKGTKTRLPRLVAAFLPFVSSLFYNFISLSLFLSHAGGPETHSSRFTVSRPEASLTRGRAVCASRRWRTSCGPRRTAVQLGLKRRERARHFTSFTPGSARRRGTRYGVTRVPRLRSGRSCLGRAAADGESTFSITEGTGLAEAFARLAWEIIGDFRRKYRRVTVAAPRAPFSSSSTSEFCRRIKFLNERRAPPGIIWRECARRSELFHAW